jgi:hypothetical protein
MDISQKAIREGREMILQHQRQQRTLSAEKLKEEKLDHLLAFVGQLERTPSGAAELQCRTAAFGECRRIAGETSGQFHGRLRHWLDRDMPQAKSRLPRSRQVDE